MNIIDAIKLGAKAIERDCACCTSKVHIIAFEEYCESSFSTSDVLNDTWRIHKQEPRKVTLHQYLYQFNEVLKNRIEMSYETSEDFSSYVGSMIGSPKLLKTFTREIEL